MKLFQIVTSDGEFNGKFDIKFSEDMNFGEGSDIDFDDESLIEKWEILYCCGDQWCEENPTNIDEEIIVSAINDDLPPLKAAIENLLEKN